MPLGLLPSLPGLNPAEAERLQELATVAAERKSEGLRIYRSMPSQMAFHESLASERVLRGGNRAGKTVACGVEFSSAATRLPILGPDGLPIAHKYPIDRPLIMWVIGYDEKHIGDVIYPILFGRRAFKMIRDVATREWRSFAPWNPDDAARESEARLAPPLIPPRMIDAKGWGWEDKAKRIFTICRLKNGTEIYAFSSKAAPRQGVPVDVIWVDEDIFNVEHYAEWQARLSDRRGRLFWSAFPQCKNEALMNLSERAEADRDNPKPDASEVVLKMRDNPFIPEDEKRKRLKSWSADEAKARDDGEFLTESVLMYPSFSPLVHGCPNKDPALDDAVDKIMRENEGQPPADWCRFLAFDPGNSPAAVLFCAIPPPEVGVEAVVAYDEIYGRGLNADELAGLVSQRTANYGFEAFIIDYRYGRQTPGGMGCTIKQLFAGAFARRSIRSRLTDSSFIDGSDDVLPGQQLVREWLAINPQTGRPKFRAYLPKLEFLPKEFTRHRKRMRDKEITDDPIRKDNHLLDCLRYLAAYNPTYVKPAAPEVKKSPVRALFQSWKDKREGDGNTICMGPGAAVA